MDVNDTLSPSASLSLILLPDRGAQRSTLIEIDTQTVDVRAKHVVPELQAPTAGRYGRAGDSCNISILLSSSLNVDIPSWGKITPPLNIIEQQMSTITEPCQGSVKTVSDSLELP